MSKNELTESEFWDRYWENLVLPATVDIENSFDRCLAKSFERILLSYGLTGRFLEVGAAPGKWLNYFEVAGLNVVGIDYSVQGVCATKLNFDLLNMTSAEIWNSDFLTMTPKPEFDVVASFGFIEHFDDAASILLKHAAWIRPGGYLIIGVPNFRFFHGFIQKHLDPLVFRSHNCTVMSKEFFKSLEHSSNLKLIDFSYIGSFEPSLPMRIGKRSGMSGKSAQFLLRIILQILFVLRKPHFLDKLNNKMVSSYIIGVYKSA
jgi:SAM-dependent methyltransferase